MGISKDLISISKILLRTSGEVRIRQKHYYVSRTMFCHCWDTSS